MRCARGLFAPAARGHRRESAVSIWFGRSAVRRAKCFWRFQRCVLADAPSPRSEVLPRNRSAGGHGLREVDEARDASADGKPREAFVAMTYAVGALFDEWGRVDGSGLRLIAVLGGKGGAGLWPGAAPVRAFSRRKTGHDCQLSVRPLQCMGRGFVGLRGGQRLCRRGLSIRAGWRGSVRRTKLAPPIEAPRRSARAGCGGAVVVRRRSGLSSWRSTLARSSSLGCAFRAGEGGGHSG